MASQRWATLGVAGYGRGMASPLRGPAKSSMCPSVGATHWVALGRSCRRARSCSEQTNREAGLGNCGRRGAPPDKGEAVPRPYEGTFMVLRQASQPATAIARYTP